MVIWYKLDCMCLLNIQYFVYDSSCSSQDVFQESLILPTFMHWVNLCMKRVQTNSPHDYHREC